MPTRVLAEALVRVEHKVDAIMRHLQVKSKPMHFIGEQCPVCSKPIEYQVDIFMNVVVRRCGCNSGKIPSGIQLLPSGDTSASSSAKRTDSSQSAPDSSGSSAGDDGSRKLRR